MEVVDLITEERKFLHDMASPLTIAQGMLDSALEILRADANTNPNIITKVEKSAKALERMTEMLRARRATIMARQEAAKMKTS